MPLTSFAPLSVIVASSAVVVSGHTTGVSSEAMVAAVDVASDGTPPAPPRPRLRVSPPLPRPRPRVSSN